MDRPDEPIIPANTVWWQDTAVHAVCRAIEQDDAAIYFVGGCVRDALLGRDGSDVDLATNLPPEDVVKRVEQAGLKAVPTGISHGTVTVVAQGRGFEVTTFRRDVSTDGRHAEVAFSSDMAEDARRRDFTMNALYARPDGRVLDPLGSGIADCLARRVRFIDDPERRITEDYLRILRYFRFFAWYTPAASGFDPDALAGISANLDGLAQLSAERTGSEILRLLAAPNPAVAVAGLQQTGALAQVLPAADARFLGPLIHFEQEIGQGADPIARLAALGGTDVAKKLRLSRKDAKRLDQIKDAAWQGGSLPAIAYRHGADIALISAMLRAAVAEAPIAPDLKDQMNRAARQRFPLKAADLMPAFAGKALGAQLRALEDRWIASDFMLSREELLKEA
ncbi:MAG: CCA tRNA nucleotidyltransferase [Roseobacter sp.]